LKDDTSLILNIKSLRRKLESFNANKQMMLDRITAELYLQGRQIQANEYRNIVYHNINSINTLTNDIEKSLRGRLNIIHPYEGSE
jgi:predicted ABC-class ATPase